MDACDSGSEHGAVESVPRKMILTTEVDVFDSADQLPADERELLEAAVEAMGRAYAPYSNFQVGAAVRFQDGSVVSGCNRENAVYKGTCAERSALDRAGVEGHGKKVLEKIAVVGHPVGKESVQPCVPCGQCRQDIREWEREHHPVVIIMASTSGRVMRVVGIGALLPMGFGPLDLGIRPPIEACE